jgi:histidinol-phosphatase (PHP family)
MWSNFHTHTNYCDGSSSVPDVVDHAKDQLISLGISSHAPVPFDCAWCMKHDDLPSYLRDVKKVKSPSGSAIEIYCGLEVDFIPHVTGPAIFKDSVDYTIGSIHFVDALPDGRPWEIDGAHHKFLTGLTSIFKDDIQDVITRYFELTRQMVEESTPDIVGHLDKIKIQNTKNSLFNETDNWYKTEVKKTLACIQQAGVIVEVNTRGVYQKKSTTTYPSPWVLEQMYDLQIPITLSSDAHHPIDLINEFANTAHMLNKIGYKQIHILFNHQWQGVSFNKNGIIL